MAVIQSDVFWEMHLENGGLKPFRDTLDQLNLTDMARRSNSCETAADDRTGRSKGCCVRSMQ